MPAIVTGIVLSAGRVFGEAAALIFTAGSAPARLNFGSLNFLSPTNPFNIFRPACSLAVYIWRLTSEPTAGSTEIVWGTATILLACVLLFNLLARLLGKLLSRRLTAE
jgi:phosphate transport system permease protein